MHGELKSAWVIKSNYRGNLTEGTEKSVRFMEVRIIESNYRGNLIEGTEKSVRVIEVRIIESLLYICVTNAL